MSKVRDLPENTSPATEDLMYIVDASTGPNASRKIKFDTVRDFVQPTAAEVKTLYESNPDTNAFTDADKTKLDTINAEYVTTVVSGRIVHYTGGQIHHNGSFFVTLAGDILLNQNITDGHIYVDVDGVVKQTGSSSPAPNLSFPIAKFTTDTGSVVSLVDHRVFINRNLFAGGNSDITTILPDDTATAGSVGEYADAGHKHPVTTAAPVSQTPDQSNAAGNANSLARSNHVHNIPSGTPVATGTANAAGSGSAFAKNDHVHDTNISSNTASATADDTTTSLTDVVINSMTITPGAGTYLVLFGSSTVNSGNGAERNYFSIYANGVQVTATERTVGISGGAYVPINVSSVVTVAASQAIDIRWRVIGGTGTVRSRRLHLVRLTG